MVHGTETRTFCTYYGKMKSALERIAQVAGIKEVEVYMSFLF